MKLTYLKLSMVAMAVLLWGDWNLRGQTLMQEPLGETKEPTMSLFLTTLPPGHTSPEHQHPGVVFIYVLEGEIESQVESNPPKIYRAGEFFHEQPMQVHRIFRNLSQTALARYLSFSNIATPNFSPQVPGTQTKVNTGAVTARLLLQDSLKNLVNQEVTLAKSTLAPGAAPTSSSTRAHQHSGPIFAFILKGDVESQVDPDPSKTYHPGDVFFEPPMHAHRLLRNLSGTDPAEMLIFQVSESGKPRATFLE
jgi:quercetin dioxygenase-like cupin family protein